jgi:hypothetical protein
MTEQAGPDPLVDVVALRRLDQRTEAAGDQPEAPEGGDAPLDATEADVQDQRTQA